MKKWLCILLALTLALGGLAGCGSAGTAETEAPAAETEAPEQALASATMDAAEGADGDGAAARAPAPEFAAARDAHAAENAVMTVDGMDIDWDKYFSAVCQYLYTFYGYYGITDFSMELEEGKSIADMAKDYAFDTLSSNAMFHLKAAELGVALTAEELASIDEEIEYYAMYYGGDRAAMFEEAGISEGYYRFQAEAALLYDALLEYYFGENCKDFPAEDALAWAEDNGYLRAQHILFKIVDDSYEPLDDETVAAKRAEADEALERLRAAAPSVRDGLFEALMEECSEDDGLAYYPDGYYFREGDMVTEFYEGALALAPGEISDVVESFYGYHIIRRLPLEADGIAEYDSNTGKPVTLREKAAEELYENMLDEWYGALDIRYAGDFETLDIAALFPAPPEEAETAEAAEPSAEAAG